MAQDIVDIIAAGQELWYPKSSELKTAYEASKIAFEHRVIIKTGMPLIDGHLGGGEVGELVLVIGEEGVGKSSFGLWWASRAAKAGTKTLYVSTEDSIARLGARLVSMGAGIDDGLARLAAAGIHKFSSEAEQAIADAQRRLESLPLYLTSLHTCSPEEAITEVASAAREGIQLVIVDYLNRLSSGQGDTHLVIPGFIKQLEGLGREYNFVPVVMQQLHPPGNGDEWRKDTARLKDSKAVADMSRICISLRRAGDMLEAHMIKSTDGLTKSVLRFAKVDGVFRTMI